MAVIGKEIRESLVFKPAEAYDPDYPGHAGCSLLLHRFDDPDHGHPIHNHPAGHVWNLPVWTDLHDGGLLPDDAGDCAIEPAALPEEVRPCDAAGVLHGVQQRLYTGQHGGV